ncbi:hypothetical protein ACJJTC_006156 [Scirpophaga incertulas]
MSRSRAARGAWSACAACAACGHVPRVLRYECVANATFDGVNTTLQYRLRVPRAAPLPHDPPQDLTLTYRTVVGGTLFYVEEEGVNEEGVVSSTPGAEAEAEAGAEAEGGAWFSVGVSAGGAVAAAWRLGSDPLPRVARAAPRAPPPPTATPAPAAGVAPAPETRARLDHAAGCASSTTPSPRSLLDSMSSRRMLSMVSNVLVRYVALAWHWRGSVVALAWHWRADRRAYENSTDISVIEYSEGEDWAGDNSAGLYFKGCMEAVHVGSLLLPYFGEERLFVGGAAALLAAQAHWALVAGRPWGAAGAGAVGCLLCVPRDCGRGRCADPRAAAACACPAGYRGARCQIDIDECVDNECQNGATCKDGVNSYECLCAAGFQGPMCVSEDGTSAGHRAQGGTCWRPGFRCLCRPGGRPQARGGPSSGPPPCPPPRPLPGHPPDPVTGKNYTCECFEGFEGENCEIAFCEREPCKNGGVCVTDGGKVPLVYLGIFEEWECCR